MGILTPRVPPGQDVPLTVLVASEPGAPRSLGALAARLAARLGHAVQACPPGPLDPAGAAALGAQVRRGAVRLVVLPLALGQADRVGHGVDELIASVRQRWPGLSIHRGLAPSSDDLARVLGDRAREATAALSRERAAAARTVVVIAGAASGSPAGNAELARLARLVYEAHRFADVGYAFLDLSPPTIRESIGRWARLGARGLVVVPALLFSGRPSRRIAAEARDAARDARIAVAVARPLASHPAVVGALVRRHLDALRGRPDGATGSVETVPYVRPELRLALRDMHAHDGGALAELEARVDALLPPRYRAPGTSVSPTPMSAGPLLFDAEGRVAWKQVWQGFCELALAGGPPHRGTLLEAPARAEVLAEPTRQAKVLRELERGVSAITGLEVLRDAAPGWIGVVCSSEAMAIWLLRAIVVENVMARREGAVLYLPAGPTFRLRHEIRNIVTALAKTHHYWLEHVAATPGDPPAP